MNLKIIAISDTRSYAWKVLVELDNATLGKLVRDADRSRLESATPPAIGTDFDLAPTLERLYDLELRERNVKVLDESIQKILEPKKDSRPL